MSRYWHPHSSEKHLIGEWDAFHADAPNGKKAVYINDPEFGDRHMCTCPENSHEQVCQIVEALNKSRLFDKMETAIATALGNYVQGDGDLLPDWVVMLTDVLLEIELAGSGDRRHA